MKKKILFFIESLSGGGAEQVLVTLLRHFDYDRYDITLLTFTDTGVHLNDIDFNKVHYKSIIIPRDGILWKFWYRIKYKLLYQYVPSWLVSKLIIPSGFDTYIAFVEGFCTKILSQLPSSISKIAWVHIDLKDYPWTIKEGIYNSHKEEKEVYEQFNKVVCVSHSVENIMKDYYGLSNTTTIYNPIDVKYICQKAQEPIDFTPSNSFNIVSVGRLVHQKGYDILIPIIAKLLNDGLNISLYILGEGEDHTKLKELINNLNLQERVHLMGFQSNPYAIVKKMDMFVCSSRAEGYSLVIAEALSLGIPVISTNCSGPNELLGNNKYGILCNDYEDLYSQIKEVVSHSEILEELHKKALKRKDTLDIKNSMDNLSLIL